MKKTLLSLVILGVSAGAFASTSGNITFTGSVTDQTCQVSVDGVADPTIVLQPTTATALLSAGSNSGYRTFDVNISGCTASSVGVRLVPINANTSTDGSLLNNLTTGNARNVGFQLLNGATVLNLATTDPSDITFITTNPEPGTAINSTFQLGVRYYSAQGGATAGAVQSSVAYNVYYP